MDSYNEGNGIGDYTRSLREKASGSLHDLRQALDRNPVISPENRIKRESSFSGSKESIGRTEHSDHSYGAAVQRLSDMLNKVEPQPQPSSSSSKTVLFTPPARPHHQTDEPQIQSQSVNMYQDVPTYSKLPIRGDLPGRDEIIQMLQNETNRIQHYESEKKFLMNEMQTLKSRLFEVLEENRILHQELKRSVVHEMVHTGIKMPNSPPDITSLFNAASESTRALNRNDYEKWQAELERISGLHLAKTKRLETQLEYAKEEAMRYEQEINDMKSKLRMVESLNLFSDPLAAGEIAGMCIKCAQNEAIIAPSVGQLQKQSIESLMRERDDLMSHVALLRTKYDELKNREDDSYVQVKSSLEMAEQAQLEMTQAYIEREQSKEELEKMRERFEEHTAQMQRQISEECELVRQQEQTKFKEINSKNKDLIEKITETQINLDRTTREKAAILAELEIARNQMTTYDTDYNKATDTMKVSISKANMERNLFQQQMERMKHELDQADRDRHAERSRLKQELEDLRRRLHQAEKELLETKDECIRLHGENQGLEREVHLVKLAKESLERSLSDDLTAADKRAELQEAELNAFIDSLQTKSDRKTNELEEYVKSHESLTQRLQEECRTLVGQLEHVTNKYKGANRKLKSENEQLRVYLERNEERSRELQEQHTQQSHLQVKMRERLQEMDVHAQRCSQQIQDLLAKESVLMRERTEITRHVEFLQRQLLTSGADDKINLYLSSRGLLDNVIKNIYNNDQQQSNLTGPIDRDIDQVAEQDMPA